MEKPETPLHDKGYAQSWKNWINWWLTHQNYATLEEAMKGTMQETRGLINPKWVIEEWEEME